MQKDSLPLFSRRFGTALLLSLTGMTAYAQAMPGMPMEPKPATSVSQPITPTPAQMQQEIESLRAQVKQLQQAHDMPTEKTDGGMGMGMGMGMEKMHKDMGMGMKKDKGMGKMPKKGSTKPRVPAPMKKGGMGMEDDAMEMPMPPADPADPAPMPHM